MKKPYRTPAVQSWYPIDRPWFDIPTGWKQHAATWLLHMAERVYLRAYGWQRIGLDEWRPPETHPKAPDVYRGGHAINSQRYYLRIEKVAQRERERRANADATKH
jgi:hypothetical protein